MSKDSLENMVGALPFPALLVDLSGNIRFSNPEAAELASATKLQGCSLFEAFPAVDDESRVQERFDAGIARGNVTLSFLSRGADGADLRVRLGAQSRSANEPVLVLLERLSGDVNLSRDVAQLEERLDQVDVIRHDLNNLLMGLMGHAELLRDSEPEDSAVHRKAIRIQEEATRLKNEIRSLKRISRRDTED